MFLINETILKFKNINLKKNYINIINIMVLDDKVLFALFSYLLNERIEGFDAIKYILLTILLYIDTNLVQSNNIQLRIRNICDTKYQLNSAFNFELTNNDITLISKLLDILNDININIDSSNLWSTLDTIFDYCFRNHNLVTIKEYTKYYNNKYLTEWIINLIKPNLSIETVFDGNIKINSYMEFLIKNNTDFKNKLYGNQSYNIIRYLINTHLSLNSKNNLIENIGSNELLINDISTPIKSFDLIFFDFPNSVHNIIHANCCNKIKKLKLRGTKFEPLLLQLIMMSLNKNGRAILTVPDSLLYSDSVQPIITRKYLLDNFNVKKIIEIDDSFYHLKNNKLSILYFENNGKTENIEFKKIYLKNNQVIENDIVNINYNIIKNNLYSLYHKNYKLINKIINKEIRYEKFSQIYDISNVYDNINELFSLCLTKYYKNYKSVQLLNEPTNDFEYYITLKQNIFNNNFYLLYLENIIKTQYELFIKGKTNQFDINKINNLEIPILSDSIQNSVCTYLNITKQLIKDNTDNIFNYNKLKICVIDTINPKLSIALGNICEVIESDYKIEDNNIIGIIRNGLTAGTVYRLTDIKNISNNSHYLIINNNNYLVEFVYHYLKCYENNLKELANLTIQPNLTKTSLIEFTIPEISIKKQSSIVAYCNDFDNLIQKCELDNTTILEKNIMSTIIKLNCE